MVNVFTTTEMVWSVAMLSVSCVSLAMVQGFKKVFEPLAIVSVLFILAFVLNCFFGYVLGI